MDPVRVGRCFLCIEEVEELVYLLRKIGSPVRIEFSYSVEAYNLLVIWRLEILKGFYVEVFFFIDEKVVRYSLEIRFYSVCLWTKLCSFSFEIKYNHSFRLLVITSVNRHILCCFQHHSSLVSLELPHFNEFVTGKFIFHVLILINW